MKRSLKKMKRDREPYRFLAVMYAYGRRKYRKRHPGKRWEKQGCTLFAAPLRLITGILILALASLCMVGCGVDDIDISGYEDQTVTIAGLEGGTTEGRADTSAVDEKTETAAEKNGSTAEETAGHGGEDAATLSIAELKAMDCVTVTTESTSDKIGRVRATGPTLDTVLQSLGTSQAQVKKLKIYARDDYDVTFGPEVLEGNDIILAFGIDGEPLEADSVPIRVIIPQSDSAYWIRMVDRIEIQQ